MGALSVPGVRTPGQFPDGVPAGPESSDGPCVKARRPGDSPAATVRLLSGQRMSHRNLQVAVSLSLSESLKYHHQSMAVPPRTHPIPAI